MASTDKIKHIWKHVWRRITSPGIIRVPVGEGGPESAEYGAGMYGAVCMELDIEGRGVECWWCSTFPSIISFIYLYFCKLWLHWVFVVAQGLLSLWHVGSIELEGAQ